MVPIAARPRRGLRLLVSGLAGVLLLCGIGVGVVTWTWQRSAIDTVGHVSFDRRLAVPPLAQSRIDEQGRRVFDLRAQPGSRDFGFGERTATWGFNGDYLGPTLRARRGERVLVNVHNGLPEPTSVHWHGMHLPASMDGGPHQEVRAGGDWAPSWTIDQPGATLWYHPHPHGTTAEHVYRGLAGMFILDDEHSDALGLPNRYGVDDVPVIVQDKRIADGQFDEDAPLLSDIGILGDEILVNGVRTPHLPVATSSVRLRLLNASNARSYNFGFSDDRPFALVGTDGGLLPAPYQTRRIQLTPGERAEVVVTVDPGERVELRSYPPALGSDVLADRFIGGADAFDVLQLRAAGSLQPSRELPGTLVDVPRLDPESASVTREFRLSGRSINGETMDMARADAVVEKGAVEIWEIRNGDGAPHNFHIHDVQFQVLSIAGERPPPHLRGWKDTVFAVPNATVRIIARFADYADPDSPYMFHCHLLQHEDQGMMGQFVVVEPGQQPGRLDATHLVDEGHAGLDDDEGHAGHDDHAGHADHGG
jgi:FtsP/CotA-like multicopper oxidase with cupredoxin domain